MKITEINKSLLPKRVKLTEFFTLEESFDPGTIIQINSFEVDDEYSGKICYKANVTALASDYKHNNSVAKKDWYDKESNPCINIFEHETLFNPSFNPEKEDFHSTIYVMDTEEAFSELRTMSREFFIEMCRSILRTSGTNAREYESNFFSSYKGNSELFKYEDESIIIVGGINDLSLSITRKVNKNPVVYVDEKGVSFRSHGEQTHLYSHVRNLILEKI